MNNDRIYTAKQEEQMANMNMGQKYNTSAIGGAYDDPKIPSRPVHGAIDRLEKTIYLIGEAVNELNNRLTPISMPDQPRPVDEPNKIQQPVPMVNALAMATNMLEIQHLNLRHMIERLAV
jgi:hypothetical protein